MVVDNTMACHRFCQAIQIGTNFGKYLNIVVQVGALVDDGGSESLCSLFTALNTLFYIFVQELVENASANVVVNEFSGAIQMFHHHQLKPSRMGCGSVITS